MKETLLTVVQARKSFGRVAAVSGVDLDLHGGEILGLIGPNGSGKSTLVNLISGAFAFDGGKLLLGGRDATRWPGHKRFHWGLARTSQVVRPFNQMTVLENVLVGCLFSGGTRHTTRQAATIAQRLLESLGLGDVMGASPADLPIQRLKRLEVARALASAPKVILLDEVLAGLTHGEAEMILDMMRKQRKEGVAILFIEHRIQTVLNISDRVLVLDEGTSLAEGSPEDIARSPEVLHAYLGLASSLNGEVRG